MCTPTLTQHSLSSTCSLTCPCLIHTSLKKLRKHFFGRCFVRAGGRAWKIIAKHNRQFSRTMVPNCITTWTYSHAKQRDPQQGHHPWRPHQKKRQDQFFLLQGFLCSNKHKRAKDGKKMSHHTQDAQKSCKFKMNVHRMSRTLCSTRSMTTGGHQKKIVSLNTVMISL